MHKAIAAAYRSKRFFLAAALRNWILGALVLVMAGFWLTSSTSMESLRTGGYTGIAAVHFWVMTHYSAQALRRRYRHAERRRELGSRRQV